MKYSAVTSTLPKETLRHNDASADVPDTLQVTEAWTSSYETILKLREHRRNLNISGQPLFIIKK